MLQKFSENSFIMGAASSIIAVICFSINDVAIKFLSGNYALHQVVLFRSIIGLFFLLFFILPFSGGWKALSTKRLGIHLLRGCCVVFANMSFFLGLAALPLAEGVAIFFISPMVITIFSVIFLKETVGSRRWLAIILGLIGVIIMVRPGTEAFQFAAILLLMAAVGYATLHMLTRYIGRTESAATMSFYIQITFIFVSILFGLILGDGRYSGGSDPSLEFLFREWSWPVINDYYILVAIGAASALGGFFISQAYRVSEAAFVAPFEYIALPMAIVWGILVFGEWPDIVSYLGIALILGSGLYMIWRETKAAMQQVPDTPRYRR